MRREIGWLEAMDPRVIARPHRRSQEPPISHQGTVQCPLCGWHRKLRKRTLARYRRHWWRRHA